jgi:hypothetical protein
MITFSMLSPTFGRGFFQTMEPAAPNLPAPRSIRWETGKFHATSEPFGQFHRNVASRSANTTPSPMFCEWVSEICGMHRQPYLVTQQTYFVMVMQFN